MDNRIVVHGLRQAVRNLGRSPWVALVIVVSLAFGTGANVAVYSAVEALLFRPPSGVNGASALVDLYTSQFNGGTYGESSYPDAQAFSSAPELAGAGLLEDRNEVSVAQGGTTAIARLAAVSDDFWATLKIQPAAGVWPTTAAPNATVISDELWQSLGRRTTIVGARITVDSQEFTVAAVLPPSFRGLHFDRTFDAWIPLRTLSGDRGDRRFAVIGRLRPGATLVRLQASLDQIATQLAMRYPATNAGTLRRPEEPRRFVAVSYSRFDPAARQELPFLVTGLFLATGMLLLSACVNAGSLLLSRALARRTEMTVKIALGADRWRLILEVLLEAIALALAGAAAGTVAAAWTSRAIPALFAPEHASFLDTHVDRVVMVIEMGAGLLAGVGFGLLPALVATRELSPDLLRGDVSRIGESQRGVRLRMLLAGAQLALSTLFLIGWTVLDRASSSVLSQAAPSRVQGELVLASVENRGASFREAAAAQLLAAPSVALVGWIGTPPLGRAVRREFRVDAGAIHERLESAINFATNDYFRGSYTPIVDGRFMTANEEADHSAVVINEAFALRYFAQRAVGRTLTDASGHRLRIVGVTQSRSFSLLGGPPEPMVYYPISLDSAPTLFAAVRFRPFASHAEVQTLEALRGAGASRVDAVTFEQYISRALASDRLLTTMVGACGLLALALAAIGVASVMVDASRRRAREMGLRSALGAKPTDIARALVGSSLKPAFAGLAIGAAAAVIAWKTAQAVVYGLPPLDIASIGETFAGLCLIVVTAVLPAILHAIRVNPLQALKEL
jgi:predicted permease